MYDNRSKVNPNHFYCTAIKDFHNVFMGSIFRIYQYKNQKSRQILYTGPLRGHMVWKTKQKKAKLSLRQRGEGKTLLGKTCLFSFFFGPDCFISSTLRVRRRNFRSLAGFVCWSQRKQVFLFTRMHAHSCVSAHTHRHTHTHKHIGMQQVLFVLSLIVKRISLLRLLHVLAQNSTNSCPSPPALLLFFWFTFPGPMDTKQHYFRFTLSLLDRQEWI